MTDRIPFPDHAWPLLRKALEHIADEPGSLWMSTWITRLDPNDPDDDYDRDFLERITGARPPECGTVACLAGHIVLAADPEADVADTDLAMAALGLPTKRNRATNGLADPVAFRLSRVFSLIDLRTYAQLREVLEDRFTFPEPLPEPAAVSS